MRDRSAFRNHVALDPICEVFVDRMHDQIIREQLDDQDDRLSMKKGRAGSTPHSRIESNITKDLATSSHPRIQHQDRDRHR